MSRLQETYSPSQDLRRTPVPIPTPRFAYACPSQFEGSSSALPGNPTAAGTFPKYRPLSRKPNRRSRMSQNLISITLTNDQITAIDHAIGELENQLQGLVSLSIDARRTAAKTGPKSEAFCRQTINALRLYPQVVPPGVGVEEARSDLNMLDQLRPLFQ